MNSSIWRSITLALCGLCLSTGVSQASVVDDDGRLDSGHPAVVVQQDVLYAQLLAALELEPGFLGMAPAVDGSHELLALFEGPAPASLPLHLAPAGWTLTARGDLQYRRLGLLDSDLPTDAEFGAHDDLPLPEDSIGIGPGSTLIINFFNPDTGGTNTGLCTAAFIMRDVNTGKVYLSSAGHCFILEGFSASEGPGADWNPAHTTRVRVCTENCLGGAAGLVSAAEGVYPGVLRDIGVGEIKLDYARQSTGSAAVGHDFGIVEIPDDLYCEIRTDMPVWRGPDSADTTRTVELGDVVVHYGNGVVMGEVVPTKARAGIGFSADDVRWLMRGAAAPGDSGSALNIATVDADSMVRGAWAAGVLTHIIITPDTGAIAGTNVARGIDMAREDAGYELEVIHDRAQVCGDAGEPVITVVGDDDPAIEYNKGWHRRADANASDGGYHRRMGAAGGGDAPTARLVFDGEAITYFYGVSEQGGSADVFIDGDYKATVDFAGTAKGNSPEFGHSMTFDGLGGGSHEFLLVFGSGAVYVDGFAIASGSADASAAGTRSSTDASNATLSLLGTATRTVTVGADDGWLSVVVEGGVGATLVDPLGTAVAQAGALVSGSDAVGIDAAPLLSGTYTLVLTGPAGSAAAVSVARTTIVE